jgi:hypothetical protein
MSADDLRLLVEKIVAKVLSRLEQDDEFSELLRQNQPVEKNQPQWARTCSSYRGQDAQEIKPLKSSLQPPKRLYTEKDILELVKLGQKELVVNKKTVLTPAARDAAERTGVVIQIVQAVD